MSNPSFPVVTVTVWSGPPSSEVLDQLSTKSSEMSAEGKTDNISEINRSNFKSTVRRNWVDTSAANEWIAFVQGVGGPLASVTIE